MSPAEFDNSNRLLATFMNYLDATRADRISTLILASDVKGLVLVQPYYMRPQPYLNPAQFRDSNGPKDNVAELLSIDGAAVVSIKRNGVVTHVQLAGNHDPRIWIVNGHQMRIVSFQILRQILDDPKAPDLVRIFVAADPLPSISDAAILLQRLKSALGIDKNLDIVARADSNFFMYGGPCVDVMSPPFPDVPEDVFYATDGIYCSGASDVRANQPPGCRLEKQKRLNFNDPHDE